LDYPGDAGVNAGFQEFTMPFMRCAAIGHLSI